MTQKIKHMDAFVKYALEAEEVITPDLRGFINVEGARVGIATAEIDDCPECQGTGVTISCGECGRNPQNYVELRSGFGDGIYPYFELLWDGALTGGLLVCDEEYGLTLQLREVISQTLSVEVSPAETAVTLWSYLKNRDLSELECSFVTSLNIPEKEAYFEDPQLIISDAGGNFDLEYAVLRLYDYVPGSYSLFAFFSREPQNLDISIPQFILLLEKELAEKIGLDSQSEIDWKEESEKWMVATEASAIEINNIRAIDLNVALAASRQLEGYFDKETEAAHKISERSWLAQLFAIGAYDALTPDTLAHFKQLDPSVLKFLYTQRGMHTLAASL